MPAELTCGLDEVPSVERYADALVQAAPSGKVRRMLLAHCRAPDLVQSADALAEVAGWAKHNTVNSAYGKLGRRIAGSTGCRLPLYNHGRKPLFVAAIAEAVSFDGAERWYWRMYREMAAAVEQVASAEGWE
jgi:hypothetical protein